MPSNNHGYGQGVYGEDRPGKALTRLIKEQVTYLYRGHKLTNEACYIVGEYMSRKRLAEIGVTSSIKDLPSWKGEAFVLISSTIDELQEKDRKKKGK